MEATFQKLLPEISHGDHCCLLYDSAQEQVAVTVPFLGYGLERNERCIYVGGNDAIDMMRQGLKDLGVNVDHEIKKNRLILSSAHDYLDNGQFNTDKMLSFLQQAYDSSLKDGYSALRAAGDISWEVGPKQNYSEIIFYEALLDIFFLGKRMVGMCQYPKDRCPPDIVEGILSSHKIATINKTVCSNFHYVPSELLLEKDLKLRHSKRVEWMGSQLLRARKAEETILQLNADLEKRVAERTSELQAAFHDMEAFSHSVSHDLRAPIRTILGFSEAIVDDHAPAKDDDGKKLLSRIVVAAERMDSMVEGLLKLARLSRQEMSSEKADLSTIVKEVVSELKTLAPERKINWVLADKVSVRGDSSLLRVVMTNLLSNAWKFTAKKTDARIEFGVTEKDGKTVYFVKDNGAGFDSQYASKLFGTFQRLHSHNEFEGTGVGLATVQSIILRHGGNIWAESEIDKGATFYFSLDKV